MREIKFRTVMQRQHDGKYFVTNGYEVDSGLSLLFGFEDERLDGFMDLVMNSDEFIEKVDTEWWEEYWCQIKLNQYTGLKDKNGVDIYEGDIVSTLLLNFYDKDGILDRKTCMEKNYDFGVVEYVEYNSSFMIMRRQYKDRVTDQWNNSMALQPCRDNFEMEVIGNIYENKELLEGIK